MALKVEIENKYGIINDYWRIDKVDLYFQKETAKVTLNGYSNKEKLPMQTKIIEVGISKELAEQFYEETKKLPEFETAEDLL